MKVTLTGPVFHLETAAFWLTKAEEMAEAAKRREVDRLNPAHYTQIDKYIGMLSARTTMNARPGGIRISYRPHSLLGALWLHWARELVPYQGEARFAALRC